MSTQNVVRAHAHARPYIPLEQVVAVHHEVIGKGDHLLRLIQVLVKVGEHGDAPLDGHLRQPDASVCLATVVQQDGRCESLAPRRKTD
jgi:hypothetical protein